MRFSNIRSLTRWLPGLLVCSLFLGGCASTQTADLELAAAQKALEDALAAKASDCASETYVAAEQKLREAKALAEKKDYEAARAKAVEAEGLANQARGESPPGCDKPKEEVVKDDAQVDDASARLGLDTIEQTIYFDFNQATIREDSKIILSKIAKFMAGDAATKIEVEGHCDSRGSTEYNLHLGERRARSVEKYLVTQGVKPEQVITISYGEERPIDLDDNEDAYQKNRRAEIKKQ